MMRRSVSACLCTSGRRQERQALLHRVDNLQHQVRPCAYARVHAPCVCRVVPAARTLTLAMRPATCLRPATCPPSCDTIWQAEMGEIGIRELGECLVAVERTVMGAGAHQPAAATAQHRTQHVVSKRLDALATPAGSRRRQPGTRSSISAQTSRPRDNSPSHPSPLPPEARVIAAGGRSSKGWSGGRWAPGASGASVASGEGSAKVVAVVKRPSKRWNTMLGAYAAPAPS